MTQFHLKVLFQYSYITVSFSYEISTQHTNPLFNFLVFRFLLKGISFLSFTLQYIFLNLEYDFSTHFIDRD